MRHTAQAIALITFAVALTGCASERSASPSKPQLLITQSSVAPRERSAQWAKYMVAGSRIARRLDTFGNPNTGTLVQTISEEDLANMPGQSLGDKLSGNQNGI